MIKTIYHGSNKIINPPVFGQGKPYNDYGLGFYCTEDSGLAMEWAVTETDNGFCNEYQLNTDGLKELNLGSGEYNILNWMAILLENRSFRIGNPMAKRARDYLLENFMIEYKSYDIIRGYRADDSYFSFANSFLRNEINLEELSKALVLGELGEQIVIKSEKAFGHISFVGSKMADKDIFYASKANRDARAREEFRKISGEGEEGTFVMDILRQEWGNDHEGLQRIIY